MIDVDIVIISDSYNTELTNITEKAIETLYKSEEAINFNTYIVESSNVDYSHLNKNIHMIYPRQGFGYNKFLNIGRKAGCSEYVCLCNNDLEFHKNWASNIIEEMNKDKTLLSASPISYEPHMSKGYANLNNGNIYGYRAVFNISGWAIFQKRSIYDIIGDLDENMTFWYADDDYGQVLLKNNLKHALIPTSRVDHVQSKTLNSKSERDQKELTINQQIKFIQKWAR